MTKSKTFFLILIYFSSVCAMAEPSTAENQVTNTVTPTPAKASTITPDPEPAVTPHSAPKITTESEAAVTPYSAPKITTESEAAVTPHSAPKITTESEAAVTPHSALIEPPAASLTSRISSGAASEAKPSELYYYCQSAKAYYPTVTKCTESWIALPLGPPSGLEHKDTGLSYIEHQEEVTSRPNVASLEFFGRALVYSLNYERSISNHVSLGAGISTWDAAQRWWNYQSTIIVLPLYANYYFTQNHSRGFLSAGINLLNVSQPGNVNNTFENDGYAAVVGGGYEYRDPAGFLFRLAGYFILGRSTTLSPSASVGITF